MGCLAPNVHEVLITHYAVAALRGVVVNLNYRLSPPEMARETDVARGRGVGCERGRGGAGRRVCGRRGTKVDRGVRVAEGSCRCPTVACTRQRL